MRGVSHVPDQILVRAVFAQPAENSVHDVMCCAMRDNERE
jgi:hypothetical protein